MKKIKYTALLTGLLLIPGVAKAHCPLCTIGAGAAAGLAVYLGVSLMSVGVMIGAFSVAMGLWISRLIKKQYIPGQLYILTITSYLTTVLPLRMMLKSYGSIYISWWGQYGKVIIIDNYIVGTIIGALILIISPYLSKQITKLRKNHTIAYQGIILTFALLLITAIIIEFSI